MKHANLRLVSAKQTFLALAKAPYFDKKIFFQHALMKNQNSSQVRKAELHREEKKQVQASVFSYCQDFDFFLHIKRRKQDSNTPARLVLNASAVVSIMLTTCYALVTTHIRPYVQSIVSMHAQQARASEGAIEWQILR